MEFVFVVTSSSVLFNSIVSWSWTGKKPPIKLISLFFFLNFIVNMVINTIIIIVTPVVTLMIIVKKVFSYLKKVFSYLKKVFSYLKKLFSYLNKVFWRSHKVFPKNHQKLAHKQRQTYTPALTYYCSSSCRAWTTLHESSDSACSWSNSRPWPCAHRRVSHTSAPAYSTHWNCSGRTWSRSCSAQWPRPPRPFPRTSPHSTNTRRRASYSTSAPCPDRPTPHSSYLKKFNFN